MDNQYDHYKKVFMANDGSGDDIKIPSVFVDYEIGMTLKVWKSLCKQKILC